VLERRDIETLSYLPISVDDTIAVLDPTLTPQCRLRSAL